MPTVWFVPEAGTRQGRKRTFAFRRRQEAGGRKCPTPSWCEPPYSSLSVALLPMRFSAA